MAQLTGSVANPTPSSVAPTDLPTPQRGRSRWRPTPSGVFALLLAAMMGWFLFESSKWPAGAALLPRVISIFGLVMLAFYAVQSLWRAPAPGGAVRQIMDVGRLDTGALTRQQVLSRILLVVGTTAALSLAIWAVGFHVAIPSYVFLALATVGKVRWWKALLAAGFFLAVLIGLYDNLIHITWHTTLIEQTMGRKP